MTNDSSPSSTASPDEAVGALLALAGYGPDSARQARVAAEFARFATMARALESAVAERGQAPLPVFRP